MIVACNGCSEKFGSRSLEDFNAAPLYLHAKRNVTKEMLDGLKTITEVLLNTTQIVILMGASGWGYYRFLREGVHRRKMQFDITCKILGPHHGAYLAEFTLLASNKGFVVHKFPSIKLRVRGIREDEPLEA